MLIFNPDILFSKLSPEAILPKAMTNGAVGFDLFISKSQIVQPDETALLPTGIATAIPEGMEGQIRLRSSIGLKTSLIMPHGIGTIDPDYRGELFILVRNIGTEPVTVEAGDRVAQLVISPVAMPQYCQTKEVEKLPPTIRGIGGFGSTKK